MIIGSENNKQYVQKRTRRAEKRARFVGVLYFLGTIALSFLAFMPILQAISFRYGVLGIATFWKPFVDLGLLLSPDTRVEAAKNLFFGFLYGFPMVFGVISAFSSLGKLDNLFMRGNRRIGYNQCYLALNKMAKIFSAVYAAIAVCSLCLIFLTETDWTNLFYFASVGFLFLHFFCGLIGGTVSRFSTEGGFKEMPRKYGLFSVFFRNLLQFAAVVGMVLFLVQVNVIPMVFAYLSDGFFAAVPSMELTEIVSYLGFPIAEVIILLCIIIIFRHACNPTEFDIDGPNAKGRKTVRVASFFILIFSLAINAFLFYFAPQKNFEALSKEVLYISAISFALFIFECMLKKFPLLCKRYKEAEDPEPIPLDEIEEKPAQTMPAANFPMMPTPPPFCAFSQMQPAPVQNRPTAPIFEGLGQGGIYIQPDGSRVMVLPIIGNAAMASPEPQPVKKIPTEHELHVRAVTDKWVAAAGEKPSSGGFSAAAYVQEKTKNFVKEEPAVTTSVEKEWRIKCPKCNALYKVTKPNATITCKICGNKFDVSKWIKA